MKLSPRPFKIAQSGHTGINPQRKCQTCFKICFLNGHFISHSFLSNPFRNASRGDKSSYGMTSQITFFATSQVTFCDILIRDNSNLTTSCTNGEVIQTGITRLGAIFVPTMSNDQAKIYFVPSEE